MTAEIVSVGTELLMGQIADTNAQHIGQVLPELGISHHFRQTVGDNLGRLAEALQLALSRADVVFTIGGLGPTQDDLTRQGIAKALGEELFPDAELEGQLRKQFEERKMTWTDAQHRQTLRLPCARAIENPHGTAPGMLCEKDGKIVIALPGPRGECVPMIDGPVRAYLSGKVHDGVIHSRVLRICGIGESMVEKKIGDLIYSKNPTVAPYAKLGEIHLRITAKAASIAEAEKLIAPTEAQIREALGDAVYGVDQTTIEAAVLGLLFERGLKVASAESVTGGGLAMRLSASPGSSKAFVGGIVAYDSLIKDSALGVDPRLLDDPAIGPVSSEVATQMAEGIRRKFAADYGVSVTGNAGPTSDKGDKPVGLVYISVAGPDGTAVEEHRLRGIREDIRYRSGQLALVMLRRVLLQNP